MANWYDDAMQLRDFADVLVEAEAVSDSSIVLKKPYQFTSEFIAWKNNGYPDPVAEDTSEENDVRWQQFVDDLDSDEEEEDEEEEEEEE